ncbi:hypothetical protein Tco_0092077 [Tanacetum coccineum]
MAGLDFCSKHNMVAYLEKNDGNTEFHQIMDFLTHSSIHFALTPLTTQKVFSNMSRKGVKFSGKVTPVFDSMVVPHQAPEGKGSEQPTEPQPTPSPTQPSTTDQPFALPHH